MFEILDAQEAQKADAAAIADGIDALSLMTAAGRSVARIIADSYAPCPILFLCGAGKNGGDGFIAASILKKDGWPVRVACLVKKNMIKGDAATAAKMWDGEVEGLNSNLSVHKTDLIVDAVFGTGLSRPLEAELVTLFDKIRTRKIPVIAVDLPSGIDAGTGQMSPGTLQAARTITFTRKKIAHMLLPASALCGKIHIAHIGISDAAVIAAESQTFENHPGLWLKDFPLPNAQSHKYSRGHLAVYGGIDRTGAACLAAAAAQRAGAGAVTIMSRPHSLDIYRRYRASIMTDAWESLDDLKTILRDERKSAVIIGPGAGIDGLRDVVLSALAYNKSFVLDADVFTAFKDTPQELFAKLSPEKHILTPHEGEFQRLFGTQEGSKLARARAAAKTANAVIVLKGADTIIAAPDGTAVIHLGGPATLATAGSGDVLSGIIGGFVVQGMKPFMAACAAVWLQGEAAKLHGLGLTAEDIIFNISHVLNGLFLSQTPDS